MSTIESIKINELFNREDYKFIIPIYQRNYSWEIKEIYTLLDDIILKDENNVYYLGTIVSYKKDDGIYEVIDGQQRLTTLYLIYLYFENYNKKYSNILEGEKLIKNELYFETRKKYVNTLKCIENNEEIKDNEVAKEIINGYNFIKNYFENTIENKEKINKFINKLKTTEIVIITVPKETDLNNYFKIMNTRGEQLEQHHIAKARFIERVGDNTHDRKMVSEIWDACVNMDYHIQRNFKKLVRKKLFSKDLLRFADGIERCPDDINIAWGKLAEKFNTDEIKNNNICINSIKNIISNNNVYENDNNDNIKGGGFDNSYNSIITFPYFLLHVNATFLDDYNHIDNFDDKKLVKILEKHLKNEESVKRFIYFMLQYRFLFDQYIVKKESQDFDDNKELELIKYKFYEDSGDYINSFSDKESDIDDNVKIKYTLNNLIKLQSTLRVTYTSQRNMQWITEILKNIIYLQDDDITIKVIIDLLEVFCLNKMKNINFNELSYNNIDRIVFTYLDYILYRDNFKNIKSELMDWIVQFKTSVDHFYPQNPENRDKWNDNNIHSFGNLSLITVSDNSKFSNYYPEMKKDRFHNIINKSPKLKLMASYKNWNEENMKEHEREMIDILKNERNRVLSKEEV